MTAYEETDHRLIRQIPLIDLRRVARYGPCSGGFMGRPCRKTAMRDDIHFARCPQADHSDNLLGLEWR